MDKSISPTYRDSAENFSRYIDCLRRRSSITSALPVGVTQQQQSSRPSKRCSEAPTLAGHGGSDGHYVARILQPPISCSETRRFIPSHHRLEEVEPVPRSSVIQNGNSLLHNSSTSTPRMDNEDRLERRIPSYLGTCQYPKILPFCSSRNSFSIPGPPVWTINSSTGIHQVFSTCDSAASFPRYPGPRLPGRLDNSCYISGTEPGTYSTCFTTFTITGMDNQLGQINVTTIQNSGLSGFTFQLRTSPHISSGLVLTYSHRGPLPSISVNSHVCSEGLIHHQPDVSLCPIYNQRPSTSPFPPVWFKHQWTQHRQSWDTPIQLDSDFLFYLRWFLNPSVMKGVPLRLPDPSLFFFTDASLKGWGASWKDHQISGIWFHTDSQRHINWLELEAIRLALLRWGPQWTNQTVRVYCDNSTAVAYIRKQGGTHSQPLFQKTLELFNLLDQFMITLIPTHLPGARNVTADALSRLNQPSPTEWRLPTETLNRLFCAFGTPLIDMYATAENKVTPVFVSPYPDDRAWAVDALSLSWDDLGLIYTFPPAPIVPKTIQKIQKSRGTTVILIASQHPSRPWHPLLLQLSTRPRIPLLDVPLFQFVPNLRRPQYHRDPKLLDLAAWHLSGTS